MRINQYWLISLFWLSCLAYMPKASAQQVPIRNYTLIEGIPESVVKSIAEDSKGFIWIATQGGVSRFDGSHFQNFTTEHGLLSNNTTFVLIDKKGVIWVATRSGLSKFDGKTFKTYTHKDGLVGNDVNTIFQDLQGNLWIGTGQGLSRFDGKTFKNFTTKNGLADNMVWAIAQDTQGDVWVGTENGLSVLDNNAFKTFTTKNGLPTNVINCLIVDSQNRVWAGTSEGLALKADSTFRVYTQKDGLPSNTIWDLETTAKGDLWIATQAGGVSLNLASLTLEQYLNQKNGLASDYLNTLYFDKNQNLWIGSDNGLSKFSSTVFEVFSKDFFEQELSVWALHTDTEGNVWLGTTGHGVYKIRPDGSKTQYTKADGLPDNYVRAIFQDSKGNLWFGTYEGASRFDGKTFKRFSEKDGLGNDIIYAITEDKTGKIWFATDGGVSSFDGENFQVFNTNNGFPHNYVRAATQDSKGNLWFGTYNGLVKYDGKKFETFTVQKNGLAHNLVLSVLEDSKKNLWVATENGLCKLKPNAKSSQKDCFEFFGKAQGMFSQNIWLLVEDKEGNIWIGHRTGVERFNPTRKEFFYYGYLDGFSLMQTYPNAVTVDKKGNIWFGTINGMIKYNPKQDSRDKNAPKVHITSIEIFGKPVDWTIYSPTLDTYFQLPIAKENEAFVEIPYNQNHITFNFIGIYLALPEKVKYRYRLEGLENEWSSLTDKTSITYTNLAPGRYRFVVEAYNKDGVLSASPAVFDFVIDNPYWEKWWFYLLQLTLFIVLIGVSIYFNTKRRRSQLTVVLSFITLLVLFEFLNVHLESYIESYIQNVPLYKTLINVIVAILFTPLEGVMRRYFNKFKGTITHEAKGAVLGEDDPNLYKTRKP